MKSEKKMEKLGKAWISNQFNAHDPHDSQIHVRKSLKSESFCSSLFRNIAGLGVIAGVYGDSDGSDACSDALIVLSKARLNVDNMKDCDFEGPCDEGPIDKTKVPPEIVNRYSEWQPLFALIKDKLKHLQPDDRAMSLAIALCFELVEQGKSPECATAHAHSMLEWLRIMAETKSGIFSANPWK